MIISRNKKITDANIIRIENDVLKKVQYVKYLRVYLDENLNFHKQMKTVCSKIASKINFMKRISKKLTFPPKKIIYNALIAPHFDYCSTLYINCNKEHLKILQKLQNRAMRIILKCEYRTHTEIVLESLNWLSINQKIKYNIMLYVFKMKNDKTPQYLSNKLEYVRDTHNRLTSARNELRLPNFKSDLGRKSLFYNGVKMYNELSNEMKNESNVNKFRQQLLNYVKENVTIKC